MEDRNERTFAVAPGRPANGRGPGGGDADAIRADIEETRRRMSATLDELGTRLNPHVVSERVRDGIRDATIGRVEQMAHRAADTMDEARTTMVDTMRDNPIPTAMVALGLGWLFFNGRRSSSERHRGAESLRGDRVQSFAYQGGNRYSGQGSYTGGVAHPSETAYESAVAGPHGDALAGGAYESEESRTDRMRERASSAGESVRGAASNAAERTGELAHRVAGRTGDMAHQVADRTRRGARRVEDSFHENPLALGAVTMALGVAAGLAIPETERERELLGGTRDRLVDQVKEVARETGEKVQHVASRAFEETQSAAREEGLTA